MPYGFNEDKSKYDIPEIPDLPIDTDTIADEAVTTAKLADESVTTAKLDDEAVTTAKLADESVTGDKLGTDVQNTLNTLQQSVSPKGSFVIVVTFSTVKSGTNYHALWPLPFSSVYSSVSIVGVSAIGGGTPAISESTAFARFVADHTIDVYTTVDAAAGKSYSLEITLQ